MSAVELKKKARPNIYEYQDYRSFLAEWFEHMSALDPNFSIRNFAARAGLSNALFSLILKGKRPLSHKSKEAFYHLLGLDSDELEFEPDIWQG